MKEMWDLYDSKRMLLQQTHERGTPIPKGKYHLVVEIWTVNKKGELLLTKRHPDKPFGKLWECTGGSVIAGENSLIGAKRELQEETGITIEVKDLKQIHYALIEDRFVDTYIVSKDIGLPDLRLQVEEVIDARFVNIEEFHKLCESNQVVPSIIERWKIYDKDILQFIKTNN